MPTQFFTDGDDTYVVDTAGEYSLVFLGGEDTLDVRAGFATAAMGNDNDRIILRSGGDALVYGESGADRFDVLGSGYEGRGGADNDTFNLYAGNNHLFRGDAGNDRFNVLAATTGLSLYGGIGNDDFNGYNHAIGGSIYGEAGNDSFLYFRGAGVSLYGGTGNDTYMVDVTTPATFVEASGEGTDLVYVPRGLSYTLGANLEYLTVRGYSGSTVGDATLNGNALNNTIRGHNNNETINGGAGNDILRSYGGNDTLNGGEGADVLDGGTGHDTMIGGLGNDTYYVDSALDLIVEGAGGGADTARASVSHALADEVENGLLLGTANLSLGGTIWNNQLTGNSGDNLIAGSDGHDSIYGGAGNDTLFGDADRDVIYGGDGDDSIYGGQDLDVLTGGAGSDRFIYLSASDSYAEFEQDWIRDFEGGSDVLDLSAIDADTTTAGNQAFTLNLTGAPIGAAGDLWTTVTGADRTFYGDVDGDGTADFAVTVTQSGMTPGDIIY